MCRRSESIFVQGAVLDSQRTLRVPSHVFGMRYVFAQNHESERDPLILLSLSLSWFCEKTQRIPDTWDGTLKGEKREILLLGSFEPVVLVFWLFSGPIFWIRPESSFDR